MSDRDLELDDERETCMACERPTYRDEAKRVDGGYLCPDCGDRWLFPLEDKVTNTVEDAAKFERRRAS